MHAFGDCSPWRNRFALASREREGRSNRDNWRSRSRRVSRLGVFPAEVREIEKMGVQTEVISLNREPIEIYSFFSRIGQLDVNKSIQEANPGDYIGVLVPGGAKSPRDSFRERGGARIPARGQRRAKARRSNLQR